MSAILGLLAIGAICAVDSANHDAKIKKNLDRMRAQGAFLPRSGQRGDIIYQDICRDWRNERKLFPKEYCKYFEINKDARYEYISALQSQQEIQEGFQPTFCVGVYDKSKYDPFRGFHSLYDEKIRIYNETGRLYF